MVEQGQAAFLQIPVNPGHRKEVVAVVGVMVGKVVPLQI